MHERETMMSYVEGGGTDDEYVLPDVCNKCAVLAAKLNEAQRLLEAWLGDSEHRYLNQDEFNQLVWDSQDLVDEILEAKKNG